MKRPLIEVPSGCIWEDDGRCYIEKRKKFLGIPYEVKIWPTFSSFLREGYKYFYFKGFSSGVIMLPDGSFEFTGNKCDCTDEVRKEVIKKLSFKIYKLLKRIVNHIELPIKTEEFYFNTGKGFINSSTEDKLYFTIDSYYEIIFSPKISLEHELKALRIILDKLSCYKKEVEILEQKKEDLKKIQQMSIERLLDNYEYKGCN